MASPPVPGTNAPRDRSLVTWALATFHVGFTVAILVAVVYSTGSLANLLTRIGTLSGLLLFGALWVTNIWATGHALDGVDWVTLRPWSSVGTLLRRYARWGGINGIAFLPILLVVVLGVTNLRSLPASDVASALSRLLATIVFALLGSLIGSLIAFPLGAGVGAVFAVVDAVLLEASRVSFVTCISENGSGIDRRSS